MTWPTADPFVFVSEHSKAVVGFARRVLIQKKNFQKALFTGKTEIAVGRVAREMNTNFGCFDVKADESRYDIR